MLSGHFDLTTGSKREAASYTAIAAAVAGGDPSRVIFISDSSPGPSHRPSGPSKPRPEIKAAKAAGLRVLLASRPGNAILGAHERALAPVIESFAEVDELISR